MTSCTHESSAESSRGGGVPCWVCGETDTTLWKDTGLDGDLRPTDLLITDKRYGLTLELYRCSRCRFIGARSRDVQALNELYEQLVDPGYIESEEGRLRQCQGILARLLAQRRGAESLLDVGAASGLLVREAINSGLDAMGIEPSKSLCEAAEKIRSLTLINGTLPAPELEGRRFDLVTLVDVIEHVNAPVTMLENAANHLNDAGLILVITPDVASITARLLGRRWWHLRLAHVGYFEKRSFAVAAEKAGLRIVKTEWAKWNFQLSYLAERLLQYRISAPVSPALRWLQQSERFGQIIIPLNLFDSRAFYLTRAR